MTFLRYPEYKESKVEWLKQIPNHWRVQRLKTIIDGTLQYGANESTEMEDRTLPRFIRITDIDESGKLKDETFKSLPLETAKPYLLNDGDVLLARSGATVGKSLIYRESWGVACFAGYLIRARVNQSICLAKWLYYYCQTNEYWGYILGTQIQTTIQNVSAEKYANLVLPLPPLNEQAHVVAFLDLETEKIDTLISEQEKLIKLLKIKLDALVLSSFDSSDTTFIRLTHVAEVIERPVLQKIGELYEPLGLYNKGRGLFHKELRSIDEMGDSDFFWINEGDLIFSGQFAWEGAVAMAYSAEEGCVVSHRYPVLRGRTGVATTEYLYALFTTSHGDFLLNECSIGAAGRNRPLNMNLLLKEKIPVPNIKLQERIALMVRERRHLLMEVSRQRDLLMERRSTLISAAVTGQIDVRNFPPEMEAA